MRVSLTLGTNLQRVNYTLRIMAARRVECKSMAWFYVVCAECARRYGPDRVHPTFRVDINKWGQAPVQVRTRSRWASLLIEDNDNMASPLVNCDHNHGFGYEPFTNGNLLTQIEKAIIEAHRVGASVGMVKPDGRKPGSERAWIHHAREISQPDGGYTIGGVDYSP